MKTVSSAEVAAHPDWLLLDVRLQEDFQCGHLPAARNNCVFEVAFGERLPALAPDQSRPVCVYGADGGSHEARMAAEKLTRAGYTAVFELREGLAGWRADGYPIEGGGPPAAPAARVLEGLHPIDLAESRVEWTGRNLLNKHYGHVALKSGSLVFQDGRLQGGEFVLDMTSLRCADLRGNDLHDVLIAHLYSDDFFDVENHPEARFVITRSHPRDAAPGSPNLDIEGELTVRGYTRPLAFTAAAGLTGEGKPAAQAALALDRTLWGVLYGSGKFFRNLGGHLVNDLVEIQIRIVAE